jgi:hypothetical protein
MLRAAAAVAVRTIRLWLFSVPDPNPKFRLELWCNCPWKQTFDQMIWLSCGQVLPCHMHLLRAAKALRPDALRQSSQAQSSQGPELSGPMLSGPTCRLHLKDCCNQLHLHAKCHEQLKLHK